MPDTRPIEERYDITYFRRRHWPDRANRWLMWLVVLGGGGALAVLAGRGDHRLYSSGPLNVVHASFGDDCAQCHQPAAEAGVNYFVPVSDSACLRCHAAAAHASDQSAYSAEREVLVPGHARSVLMAARCAECHIEHRGRESDLRLVADRTCVQCHEDLSLKGYSQRVERDSSDSDVATEDSP